MTSDTKVEVKTKTKSKKTLDTIVDIKHAVLKLKESFRTDKEFNHKWKLGYFKENTGRLKIICKSESTPTTDIKAIAEYLGLKPADFQLTLYDEFDGHSLFVYDYRFVV